MPVHSVILFLLAFLSSLSLAAAGTCGPTLIGADFNRYSRNSWTTWNRNGAEDEFPNGLRYTKSISRSSVGYGHLRVTHPRGCVGAGQCGMLFAVNLPRELDEATLTYRVKFQSGYHWTAGGKLPGLCDYDCPTGCVNTRNNKVGWSSRIMWRPEGKMESYMYYPYHNGRGTCGEEWDTRGQFQAGKWHTVVLYIKLNDPRSSNGEQRLWLDGQEVYSNTRVRFRRESGHRIKQLKFENFHGGKTDAFRPSKTQYVEFDDFKVQDGMCTPSVSQTTFRRSSPLSQSSFVEERDSSNNNGPAGCEWEERTKHWVRCGHNNDGNEGNEGNEGADEVALSVQRDDGNDGDEGNEGNEGNEGDEGNEGNEGTSSGGNGPAGCEWEERTQHWVRCGHNNDGNEGNEGNEGADVASSSVQRDDGNEGDEGNEGNEGDEGNEGNEGDEGNEGNEGDEGNEGNEGTSSGGNGPAGCEWEERTQHWVRCGHNNDGNEGNEGNEGN